LKSFEVLKKTNTKIINNNIKFLFLIISFFKQNLAILLKTVLCLTVYWWFDKMKNFTLKILASVSAEKKFVSGDTMHCVPTLEDYFWDKMHGIPTLL
jgi:hypothetical protein